jgi:NADH dehydrogenase FAD-containing subunit
VINFAENELKKLHIDIIKDTKILSSTSDANGKTSLVLSNNETMAVDLYIPTMGVVPNTEFIPKSLLSEKGKVMVDQFLRVKGVEDVWAAGDVTNLQPAQIIYAGKSIVLDTMCSPVLILTIVAQAEHLSKNLALILNGKEPLAYRTDGSRKWDSFTSFKLEWTFSWAPSY